MEYCNGFHVCLDNNSTATCQKRDTCKAYQFYKKTIGNTSNYGYLVCYHRNVKPTDRIDFLSCTFNTK